MNSTFGGTIVKQGKHVKTMQYDCSDVSYYEHEIKYDGELTPEVCQAIKKAWDSQPLSKPESSWGMLRWSAGHYADKVDVERRVLITHSITRLCD